MKKLNLKLGSIKEMLTKEQMKKVVGGGGYGCMFGEIPCNCRNTTFCVSSLSECIMLCTS